MEGGLKEERTEAVKDYSGRNNEARPKAELKKKGRLVRVCGVACTGPQD